VLTENRLMFWIFEETQGQTIFPLDIFGIDSHSWRGAGWQN